MKKVGRLTVLLRLLAYFCVTPTPFRTQLAVSANRESPADDSSVCSFSKDGGGGVQLLNEAAVLGHGSSGAIIVREQDYGTSSPGTSGKPRRSDSVLRRQRRGSLSSPTYWRLSGEGSRTRSSLRVSNILKAATLVTATTLVLWQLANVVWRCLDRNYTAKKYVGTTPRLLRKSKKSPESTPDCVEWGNGNHVAGKEPTGAHPSGIDNQTHGGNPFVNNDATVQGAGNPFEDEDDLGVGNPFANDTEAGTGNPFEYEDEGEGGNPFENEDHGEGGGPYGTDDAFGTAGTNPFENDDDDEEGNLSGNGDATGARGTKPLENDDGGEGGGFPGHDDEDTRVKEVSLLGGATRKRRHSARATLSFIVTTASVGLVLGGIIGAACLLGAEQPGSAANATATPTTNRTATSPTTTSTHTPALILSFALVCGAALKILYSFHEAKDDLRSGLEKAGRSLPLLGLLGSISFLLTVSALAILAVQLSSPLAVYLLDVVAVIVVTYLIFPYLAQLVTQVRGRLRARDI